MAEVTPNDPLEAQYLEHFFPEIIEVTKILPDDFVNAAIVNAPV